MLIYLNNISSVSRYEALAGTQSEVYTSIFKYLLNTRDGFILFDISDYVSVAKSGVRITFLGLRRYGP